MLAYPDFPLEVGHPPPRWRMRRCLASASTEGTMLEWKGFARTVALLAMVAFSPFVSSILAKINEIRQLIQVKGHTYLNASENAPENTLENAPENARERAPENSP